MRTAIDEEILTMGSRKETYFWETIFSIPKSLYLCLRLFPFKEAIRMPILVSFRTKIMRVKKNTVKFEKPPGRFQIKIGIGGSEKIHPQKSRLFLDKGAIIFEGSAVFAGGTVLANAGIMRFGTHFYCNKNCTIWCTDEVSFGEDCLLGWNIMIHDDNGHIVTTNGKAAADKHPGIRIGDHCWICSDCTLLRGSGLGSHSILGCGSVLTKMIQEDHVLIAGNPGMKKKENIDWSH